LVTLGTSIIMGIFSLNKKYYHAIKLYKVVDGLNAQSFPSSQLTERLVIYFNQTFGSTPDFLNVNYGREFKTFDGFNKALKKKSEIDQIYVAFDSAQTNCYFSFSNPVTHSKKKPLNSMIELVICLGDQFFNTEKSKQLVKELLQDYDFQYGYIQRFEKNVSYATERKMKVNFLYTSSNGHPIDRVWTFHSVGIQHGYLKKLYNINYLNKSQFEDKDLKILIDSFGTKEMLNENILCWTISDNDIEELMKQSIMQIKLIQFDLDKNLFVQSDDAKKISLLMEYPT
jgi:hypothetical protein